MESVAFKRNQGLSILAKMLNWPLALTARVIDFLESPAIPFINTLMTLFSCIILRNFIEFFSQKSYNALNYYPSTELLTSLLHFDSSFIMVALMITLLIHYLTDTPVEKIVKVVFPGFIFLILTPVVDLIASHGEGYDIAYLRPTENHNLFSAYFAYFGDYAGASIGIKVEIALALAGVFFYCFTKTRSLIVSLCGSWLVYTIIFIWGSTPFVIKLLTDLVGVPYPDDIRGYLICYFFLFDFLLAIWVAYLANKDAFIYLLREIPMPRVLHYEVMFFLGMYLGLNQSTYAIKYQLISNPTIIFWGILLSIGIFFSLLFAMFINNLADMNIDKISNPHRVLVSGTINKDAYSKIGYSMMLLALVFALPVGMQGVFILAFIMATYYLYSSYPLRLKRIPVLSKLVIAGNSLALMILGFWVVKLSVMDFPPVLFPLVLIGMTLAANFIDLKDVKGDTADGIKTLPVILGMRAAQWFCGIVFFLAYLSLHLVFKDIHILPELILFGAVQCYLLARKQYREGPVFLVYFTSLVFLWYISI